MNVMKDLGDIFGSTDSNCLCYTPMAKADFLALLKKQDLVGTKTAAPHLFFPEMVDKLYLEMGRAGQAMDLNYGIKQRFLTAAWQVGEETRSGTDVQA